MEETQLRFGDATTADVKFWLTGPNDEKYERNPVHLHSLILDKSEYFKARMSERWSSDGTKEMILTTTHNFDEYLKCIQLMYVKWVNFTSVEECLAVLSVASELLADDAITKCMEYLEGVRWSAEQETQIEDVLSSLGLKVLPELAARFDKEDDERMTFEGEMITLMFSIIESNQVAANVKSAEKYIMDILEENTCGNYDVGGYERAVIKVLKRYIRRRDFSGIGLVFNLIEHCEGGVLKAAFTAFCDNSEFIDYIDKTYMSVRHDANVLSRIIWFMEAIGEGKIIISKHSRISFLTAWLPVIAKLGIQCFTQQELDKATANVVESLPLIHRRRICMLWTETYKNNDIDISAPLRLLKDAHHKLKSKP